MNDALMYFLKVNIAIALFYLFFRLLFYNDTFWKTRRFYLVFSILLSVIYPFVSLTGWLEKQEPMQTIITNYAQLQAVTVTPKPKSAFTIENVLLSVYALVSVALLVKMLLQLVSILRWKLKGEKKQLQGTKIISIKETIAPFSFFNYIFINPALHSEQEISQILAHEKTHALQMHSLDVLVSEMLTITCWINPAAWLLKREIRHNLEFLADSKVVESGFDSKDYQYHLLQLSYQSPEVKLGNKFNVSPLKKRIIMMNQQKTKKTGIMKYSLIVPLALALVLSSNAQTIVNSAKKTPTTKVASQPSKKNLVYNVVEKMPQYPGGETALLNYINKNIKYPKTAQDKGIQGKVILRFVVNSTGKVERAEIIRSLYPACDKESLRVIKSLHNFTPGEQKGEKVAVWYTLPITFKIS